MYEYKCLILSVVDGDTCHADVDLGFDTSRRMVLRFYGINVPEMKTEAGKAAREFLVPLIEGKSLTIRTVKDRQEKFGRYLASLFLPGEATSINDQLVAAGHAVPYMV